MGRSPVAIARSAVTVKSNQSSARLGAARADKNLVQC